MTLTLQELKEKLANRLDEVSILELLNITSFDLVERFEDFIEERYEHLCKQIEDDY